MVVVPTFSQVKSLHVVNVFVFDLSPSQCSLFQTSNIRDDVYGRRGCVVEARAEANPKVRDEVGRPPYVALFKHEDRNGGRWGVLVDLKKTMRHI